MDKAEIAVIKTVASRLREARELCKFQTNEAAAMLGITADELGRIEIGSDFDEIPLRVIQRASVAYDVSTDFLFGLNEDWEQSEDVRMERDTLSFLSKMHIQDHSKTIAKQLALENKINVLAETVASLIPAIKEVDDVFMRFWQQNQEFSDMRCGSMFVNALDSALKLAAQAGSDMKRSKLIKENPLQGFADTKRKPLLNLNEVHS